MKFIIVLRTGLLISLLGVCFAQDLVTQNRIGRADAPNTMTFAALASYTNSNATPEFAQQFTEAYEAFAQEHPDWRIDVQLLSTNIGQEMARILEQARVGRAPDCATIDSFQLALFMRQNALQPVTPYFTEEQLSELFPYVREGMTGEDGEIYAYWFDTGLRVLYYRTDVVPEAPRTWAATQEAALSAKEQNANFDGILFSGGRWEGTTFDFLSHFWSQGGELVNDQGEPIFAEEPNRAYLVNALSFYRDLVNSGAAPQRVASIATYDEMLASARAGTTAMFQGASSQWAQLEAALTPEELANWAVTMPPAAEEDRFSTGTGGWAIAALSDDPAKIELCMELAKAVYRGPANSIIGNLPTSQVLFDTLPRFQGQPFDQYREFLQYGQARPGVPIYPELSNQFQIMISEVLTGAKEPGQAVDDAARRVEDAYQRLQ